MMTPSEEDFELELRTLPGVLSVGVDHRDNGDVERVTLFVRGQDPESVRHVALQVASLYYPKAAVMVEDANRAPILGGKAGERARVALVRTDFNVHDGVSEVHLNFAGRVGIGRSGSGPLVGGAEADPDRAPRARLRRPVLPRRRSTPCRRCAAGRSW